MNKQIKRCLTILLIAAVALSLLCVNAFADESNRTTTTVVSGKFCNNSWALDDSGVLTISGTGPMGGYITDECPWYIYKEDITSVVICEGITTVGAECFDNYSNITSISLPSTLTTIEECAFCGCVNLDNAIIPSSVKRIGMDAFAGCTGLTQLQLPDGVSNISEGAFRGCTGLKNFTIPQGVSELPYGMLSDCTGLTEIIIPGTITYMGDNIFSGCTNLKDIYFIGDAPSISGNTFKGVTATIYYPDKNPYWQNATWRHYGGKLDWKTYNPSYKISDCTVSSIEDVLYTGNANTPSVTVKNGDIILTAGIDYTLSYEHNIDPGIATVVVTGIGKYIGTTTKNFNINYLTQTITANSYTKEIGNPAFILGAKTSGDGNLSYTSSNTNVVTVSSTGKVTIKGVGTASITVTAASTTNYKKATKTVTITVNPNGTVLSGVKNVFGKKMTVIWNKNAAVTGYQIQYSTSSKFSGPKTLTVKSYKTTSSTIFKLTRNKKYYVHVRTYKTVSKVNYYSAWSDSKNVTIKK